MTQVLSLALGVNLLFAQAAVASPTDSWFGADKIKHFFLSAFATSISFSALQAAGANRRAAMGGAIGASLALGVAREIYNRRTTQLFSIKDLTWGAMGTAAAAPMLNQTRK
jgi:putative lipoprotein